MQAAVYHYYDSGGQRPALVFIHGAYLSHQLWQHQFSALHDPYRLIALDLAGHGGSRQDSPVYSTDLWAQQTAALLAHIGPQPFALIGHSLGGMVAQSIVSQGLAAPCALVLAETSYGTRATWHEALLTNLATPLLRLISIPAQARLYARQFGRQSAAAGDYVRQQVLTYANDPARFHAIWWAVTAFNGRAALAQIATPTLVMVGEHNKQTHSQARTLAGAIANAHMLTIPRAGHLLMWDNPDAFNASIAAFVRTHCG